MVIIAGAVCCCRRCCSITVTVEQAGLKTSADHMFPKCKLNAPRRSCKPHQKVSGTNLSRLQTRDLPTTQHAFLKLQTVIWYLSNRGLGRVSLNGSHAHHSELLQFLVAFDEEGTLPVSCPVAVTFASPTCSKGTQTLA